MPDTLFPNGKILAITIVESDPVPSTLDTLYPNGQIMGVKLFGGGGGVIGGTIAATQVAFGSALNTIAGEAAFTYDSTLNLLRADNVSANIFKVTGSSSGTITIQGAAAAGTWTLTLPTDDGTSGQALITDGNGVTSWATVSATPGGLTTQVQFNDAGAFGGDSSFTWNKTLNNLSIGNGIVFGDTVPFTGVLSYADNIGVLTRLLQHGAGSGITNTLVANLQVDPTADSTRLYQSVVVIASTESGNTHSFNNLIDIFSPLYHAGSGTIQYALMYESDTENYGGGTLVDQAVMWNYFFNAAGSTITRSHGWTTDPLSENRGVIGTRVEIDINPLVNAGGGTITNNYGIRIANFSALTGITLNRPFDYGSGKFYIGPDGETVSLSTATATSFIGIGTSLTFPGSLSIASGKILTASNTLTFVGTDSTTLTFPTTSATIARTDAGQTFTGVNTMTAPVFNTSISTPLIVTVAGAALSLAPVAPAVAASGVAGVGITLTASNATAGNVNNGAVAGGNLSFITGNAARLVSNNANGGSFIVNTGTGIGTGTRGGIAISTGAALTPVADAIILGINGAETARMTASQQWLVGYTSPFDSANLLGVSTATSTSSWGFEIRNTTVGGFGSWIDFISRDNYSGNTIRQAGYIQMLPTGAWTSAGVATSALIFATIGANTVAERARFDVLGLTLANAHDIIVGTSTGTKIGTATTQKIGFYNATPIVQGASVADATGGAIIDAEARTAINALISRIEATGLIATV